MQQLSELKAVPGVDIVGPLPAALQTPGVFAAVFTGSAHVTLAHRLLQTLASAEAGGLPGGGAGGHPPGLSFQGLPDRPTPNAIAGRQGAEANAHPLGASSCGLALTETPSAV